MSAAFKAAERSSVDERLSGARPCCARVEFTSAKRLACVEGAPCALGTTITESAIAATIATNDPPVFLIVRRLDDAYGIGFPSSCMRNPYFRDSKTASCARTYRKSCTCTSSDAHDR